MAEELSSAILRRLFRKMPRCTVIGSQITTLSDFLEVFDSLYRTSEDLFWFRGHGLYHWRIWPSALRYDTEIERERALKSISEFRQLQEFRFAKTPHISEKFKWLQLAQHYGLPTRLLDWTQNPAVALYFACEHPEDDGLLLAFNPRDLNRLSLRGKGIDIVDPDEHTKIIDQYLSLGPVQKVSGRKTIGVKPVWNSDRIILQQGTFTFHGEVFELDDKQAPSLIGVPILKEHKSVLLHQLERIGISEMFIFPEAEHVCNYLKSKIRVR